MSDISETIAEAVENAEDSKGVSLNSVIALLVALIATFMALCNIKDGNIVQTMSQQQAKAVDSWAYYQSKSMKQNLAESMLDQLTLQKDSAGAGIAPDSRPFWTRRSRPIRGRRRSTRKRRTTSRKRPRTRRRSTTGWACTTTSSTSPRRA